MVFHYCNRLLNLKLYHENHLSWLKILSGMSTMFPSTTRGFVLSTESTRSSISSGSWHRVLSVCAIWMDVGYYGPLGVKTPFPVTCLSSVVPLLFVSIFVFRSLLGSPIVLVSENLYTVSSSINGEYRPITLRLRSETWYEETSNLYSHRVNLESNLDDTQLNVGRF